MLNALFLSIGQLGDRRILAVLAKSLALTLAILVIAGAGLIWGAHTLAGNWLASGSAVANLAAAGAALLAVMSAWLLFRVVAIAVIGVFADDVVKAVEAKHYPSQ